MTSFEQILESSSCDQGLLRAEVTQDWAQGRTAYGGLAAALCARAMGSLVEPGYEPRSFQCNFAGPVAPGPVEARAEVLRMGSSAVSLAARLEQNGKPRCLALGAFGRSRPGVMELAPEARPQLPPPEQVPEAPFIKGMSPEFLRHFSVRWAEGAPPLSGASSTTIGGWFRLNQVTAAPTWEWWVLLADAWPTPLLSMMSGRSIFSSLNWTLDFFGFDPAQPLDGWWAYRARAQCASGGYGWCRADIWAPDGTPVMTGRQTVAVFTHGA